MITSLSWRSAFPLLTMMLEREYPLPGSHNGPLLPDPSRLVQNGGTSPRGIIHIHIIHTLLQSVYSRSTLYREPRTWLKHVTHSLSLRFLELSVGIPVLPASSVLLNGQYISRDRPFKKTTLFTGMEIKLVERKKEAYIQRETMQESWEGFLGFQLCQWLQVTLRSSCILAPCLLWEDL